MLSRGVLKGILRWGGAACHRQIGVGRPLDLCQLGPLFALTGVQGGTACSDDPTRAKLLKAAKTTGLRPNEAT
jgi:hypothetical protein